MKDERKSTKEEGQEMDLSAKARPIYTACGLHYEERIWIGGKDSAMVPSRGLLYTGGLCF